MNKTIPNRDLRRLIVEMIYRSKEGHIPSSFSIVDLIHYLYAKVLKYDAKNPKWIDRDYFILSKGHGCAGLYVVLHKFGFLSQEQILSYSSKEGILGGHPDMTKVPGVEASTGSLGHGFPTAAGVALGLKIQKKSNRVFALLGDGECNEGTIWETALAASARRLDNLTAIVDLNGSSAQILPIDPLSDKWRSFGWNAIECDGHDDNEIGKAISSMVPNKPNVIIARTIKGKGVSFVEGHGKWHHRIPNSEELQMIYEELR